VEKKLGTGASIAILVGGTAAAGVLFVVYESLRRTRRDDFPFQFEPLFLHGLLLVAIGLIGVAMIKIAWDGGRLTSVIAAALIAGPSFLLAFAPYAIVVLEWSFVPERLVGEGFHQIGMVGIGTSLAVLIGGLLSAPSDGS
jgi:hypothetical protein